MTNFLMKCAVKKTAIFVGGMIVGSLGNKAVSCPCVKKTAVQVTAGALKVKDNVLNAVIKLQENVEDVLAEAKELNEKQETVDTFEVTVEEIGQ